MSWALTCKQLGETYNGDLGGLALGLKFQQLLSRKLQYFFTSFLGYLQEIEEIQSEYLQIVAI